MKYKSVDIIGKDVKGNDVLDYVAEVEFPNGEKDGFLITCETLTRIGLASKKEGVKELFQSVHCLHKQGRYFLCHLKHMFMLDYRQNTLTTGDIARYNLICDLMEEWGIVCIKNYDTIETPQCSLAHLAVLSHEEAKNYKLTPKYKIGKKK